MRGQAAGQAGYATMGSASPFTPYVRLGRRQRAVFPAVEFWGTGYQSWARPPRVDRQEAFAAVWLPCLLRSGRHLPRGQDYAWAHWPHAQLTGAQGTAVCTVLLLSQRRGAARASGPHSPVGDAEEVIGVGAMLTGRLAARPQFDAT